MTTKTTKPEPLSITELAVWLENQIRGVVHFTDEERDALNSLATSIFVQAVRKNLDDFGISRPGR